MENLKMEEVVEKVCQGVVVEALTPADAAKAAQAEGRVEQEGLAKAARGKGYKTGFHPFHNLRLGGYYDY